MSVGDRRGCVSICHLSESSLDVSGVPYHANYTCPIPSQRLHQIEQSPVDKQDLWINDVVSILVHVHPSDTIGNETRQTSSSVSVGHSPRKPQIHHLRALQSPGATAPSPFPAFYNGLRQWYCDFCFCESLEHPHHQGRISALMAQHSKWISNEFENPNFRLHHSNCIDDRFWSNGTEFAWCGLTIKVEL
ncbi:hypothetical protein AVEN_203415-1 [Araneus ventricosus]|uniref:Uncharacterized protein n=1 Tax=Araneus ventricosus TaxID=182803 RepID=A0A4Y2X2D2_ARAVE|nr:hypothetical protein AVEN_203415-1 [Araneus ventricosus]